MKINYFPHDCSASGDYKLAALETEHGAAGYAVFFKSVEILHSCKNGTLDIESLAKGVGGMMRGGIYDVKIILESCLKLGLLESKTRKQIVLVSSKRIQQNVLRIKQLSEKNRRNALRGAELREKSASDRSATAQGSLAIKSKSKLNLKLNLNEIKDQESKTPAPSEPITESESIPKPCLILYGKTQFRTTAENYEKLIEKFSRPLLEQELGFIDEWISLGDTPNARKYRKPNYDHYLMACNWLKDKKLKYTSNRSNGGTNIVEEESDFIKSIRHCVDVMGITDERPNGFETWKKKETTDAN